MVIIHTGSGKNIYPRKKVETAVILLATVKHV
jgi:hypothetical protein